MPNQSGLPRNSSIIAHQLLHDGRGLRADANDVVAS